MSAGEQREAGGREVDTSYGVPSAPPGGLTDGARGRAALLLQHQLSMAEQIVEHILQSQRQRDVASRMTFGAEPSAPPSIDRTL